MLPVVGCVVIVVVVVNFVVEMSVVGCVVVVAVVNFVVEMSVPFIGCAVDALSSSKYTGKHEL